MKQEYLDWIENNWVYFGNVTLNREVVNKLFEIYNSITNENKRPTSCGRCVNNVKKRIVFEYEKTRSKN